MFSQIVFGDHGAIWFFLDCPSRTIMAPPDLRIVLHSVHGALDSEDKSPYQKDQLAGETCQKTIPYSHTGKTVRRCRGRERSSRKRIGRCLGKNTCSPPTISASWLRSRSKPREGCRFSVANLVREKKGSQNRAWVFRLLSPDVCCVLQACLSSASFP